MTEADRLALERAARTGDVAWLQAAADQGHGQAAAQLAVLAAVGACLPQSWSVALDHLQRAAELQWVPAQRSLTLLAAEADPDANPSSRDWRALRNAVAPAIDTLIGSPPKQPLCDDPRIRTIPGFASPALCDWLIDRARHRLSPARVYDPATGAGVRRLDRNNTEADFDIVQTDIVLALLRARMASATGLPPAVMELARVLHYDEGQTFAAHVDYLDPAAPGLAAEIDAHGQRLVTVLLYLNDDFDGGATAFPAIGLHHRARRGDALMFANVDRAGHVDPKTVHAGLPPSRGRKWVLSQWIRDRVPMPAPPAVATAAGRQGAQTTPLA